MKPNIDRRKLVLAALATGCLASLTPEALAQVRGVARATGRPLLTAASLSRAIPPPNARNYNFELRAAADDLQSYLRARFTLTADQERFLAGLTPADKAQFRQSHMSAMARGDLVRVDEVRGGCQRVRILAGSTSVEVQNRGVQMGNFETPSVAPQQAIH
jgi:hypothetical protein